PLSRVAMFEAMRPRVWPSASTTYHSRWISSSRGMTVFIRFPLTSFRGNTRAGPRISRARRAHFGCDGRAETAPRRCKALYFIHLRGTKSSRSRRPVRLPEEPGQAGQWKPHDVEVAALDPLHPDGAEALDPVSPGLVHGLARLDVSLYVLFR